MPKNEQWICDGCGARRNRYYYSVFRIGGGVVMPKRCISFVFVVFLIIGIVAPEAGAATYETVYRHNLAVTGTKSHSEAALAYYLRLDVEIQCDDPDIIGLASSITAGMQNDYEKVKAIHEWVSGNIWYDKDMAANSRNADVTVKFTLNNKRGICYSYAGLTAALLGAIGIPAKIVTGYALGATGSDPAVFFDVSDNTESHAWNEVYVDGRWVITDVTWDSRNVYKNGVYSTKAAPTDTFFDVSLAEISKTHRYLDYTDYGIMDGFLIENGSDELKHIYDWQEKDTFTDIVVPAGIKSIGSQALNGFSNLRSAVVPDGVTSIGDYAFSSCPDLLAIVVPDSVIHIGEEALGNRNLNPLIKIYGGAGSCAEAYAKENALSFVTGTPSNLYTPSSWAADRVSAAITAELVPLPLQSQYTLPITRAEYCALAAALYEKHTGKAIAGRVKFDDTGYINVEKMAAVGVVTGVGDNKFAPNDTLTREQAAVILARLAEALGKPQETKAASFADNAAISPWASESVGQMQAAGIMSGIGDNTFAPKDPYTREQGIITMLSMLRNLGTK
jgi:hypothetical protein